MSDVVTVGISRVHNSSVSLFVNKEIIFHIENERLSNIKYDKFPFAAISKIKDYVDHVDNIAIAGVSKLVQCESFDSIDMYSSMVLGLGKSFISNNVNIYDYAYDHHKLHALSSFYHSGFRRALCIVKDGMGSEVPLEGSAFIEGTYGRENGTSFILDSDGNFDLIKKEILVNFPIPTDPFYIDKKTYLTNCFSEGLAFQKTAKFFGFHELDAGKVMGMAPYGSGNKYQIVKNNLINSELFRFDNNNLTMGYLDLNKFNSFEEMSDFAYDLQDQIQNRVAEEIIELIEKTGEKNICLSGGFFLNCVNNNNLLKRLPKGINIYVEPISSDAGTSIGAALMADKNYYRKERIKTIYLGPKNKYKMSKIQELTQLFKHRYVSHRDVANLLFNNKIVAIFQGGSESGPRALGNRSILYTPTDPNGKDYINRIKKREWFRPFAGTVLKEYADEWIYLRGLDESPFMMYALDVKEDKIPLIPSIVHVDGTCRMQTITIDQNYHYYSLIKEFYTLSSVPILFNTSFNLAGDCINETIDDAVKTLYNSEIDYLYLPEHGIILY